MSGSPRPIPVVHNRRRCASTVNIEKGLSAIKLLEQADERERSLFAELESARDERSSLRGRIQEMRGEHAQALCVKDAFIERLTADFAAERAQFLALLKSERATAQDVSDQLRLALEQKVKDANDKATAASLRAENLQLLSKLAAGEASEAKSRAAEYQLAVSRLEADRAVAVRLQLSAQAAELEARRDQCSLREQLLALRSRLSASGSPVPAPAEFAHEGPAVSLPSPSGSTSPFGSNLVHILSVSPPRGGFEYVGPTSPRERESLGPPRTPSLPRFSSRDSSPAGSASSRRRRRGD